MATFFEAIIPHTLGSIAIGLSETLFAEVDRVERLISRFDPTSEVSRVNRIASEKPLKIDIELHHLLLICQEYWRKTEGAFDPASFHSDCSGDFAQVELDTSKSTVFFKSPDLRLDFGAVGKGYALQCCRKILESLGAKNLLLHGGTSSILAVGGGLDGNGWRVGVRNPNDPKRPAFECEIRLHNQSLSTSGVIHADENESDLFDPGTGRPLSGSSACSVIANDPVQAEILSTAFLVMGRQRAEDYLLQNPDENLRVAWLEGARDGSPLSWIQCEATCA